MSDILKLFKKGYEKLFGDTPKEVVIPKDVLTDLTESYGHKKQLEDVISGRNSDVVCLAYDTPEEVLVTHSFGRNYLILDMNPTGEHPKMVELEEAGPNDYVVKTNISPQIRDEVTRKAWTYLDKRLDLEFAESDNDVDPNPVESEKFLGELKDLAAKLYGNKKVIN